MISWPHFAFGLVLGAGPGLIWIFRREIVCFFRGHSVKDKGWGCISCRRCGKRKYGAVWRRL